ncbi:MAG: alpha/beta hydrolase [Patescibacteria group bacterium]
MKEHFWEEKGIYYRMNEFKPNRLTLVFIHGLSGSSSAWWPYEKIFENKYNMLTYDIRGHGKSKKFSNYSDYEIKNFANDLHDLFSYLKISPFVLVGHSMGTLIAGEYIKRYRESVLAVIFLSPIFNMEKEFSGKILRLLLRLNKIFSLFPFNPKLGHHVDYAKYPNTTDWNMKRFFADSLNTTFRVHLYCLKQSMMLEQEYFLEKIKIPTLIVHGVNDSMVPVKNAITLSGKIENAELVLIPNTDHIVVLNNVKEISKIVEDFIEKNKEIFKNN